MPGKPQLSQVAIEKLEKLVTEAKASGGSEMANYQLFVIGLTEALGLERPKMAGEAGVRLGWGMAVGTARFPGPAPACKRQ